MRRQNTSHVLRNSDRRCDPSRVLLLAGQHQEWADAPPTCIPVQGGVRDKRDVAVPAIIRDPIVDALRCRNNGGELCQSVGGFSCSALVPGQIELGTNVGLLPA